ncbi:KRAB-A domain-containing protein 2-like [Littorina saxatilis]|uniref:KRAB-A domain-containing protein 2-like n=1 Tax=Littorina saxatilis TaxID=31220 RepID=UPI0038B4EA2D
MPNRSIDGDDAASRATDWMEQETTIVSVSLDKGEKCGHGAGFKSWCMRHFKLQRIGGQIILCCKKESVPVVCKEDLYNVIKRCHLRVGHSGRTKTWQELRSNYAWIRHDLVQLFLRTCQECATRATVNKPAVGKPIISLGFLTRVQMDLIDMRTRPDGDFSWIIHLRDHYSKFSWVHPMTSKRAVEVAENVLKTFYLFGAPKILQSDNGKEFVAGVILELVKIWEGMIIINGPKAVLKEGMEICN